MSLVDVNGLFNLGFELKTLSDSEDQRLVLIDLNEPKMSPLAVDFLDPKILHRLKHGLGKSQPMARALGMKSLDPSRAPVVFDATAGMGIDAFFFAALGCRVRAVERSPIVAELLQDGLRRLQRSENIEPVETLAAIFRRLSFEHGDARTVLEPLSKNDRPDVVYLDPMFPEEGRSESALPKKAMQMFRKLIGEDLDSSEVFDVAMRIARSRVVVKRPVRAESIVRGPTHSFIGKTARFDMYLV